MLRVGGYETPGAYIAIHILLGALAGYNPEMLLLLSGTFCGWQALQLFLGVRVFALEWKVRRGNSLIYTMYKIAQFVVGLGMGWWLSRKPQHR